MENFSRRKPLHAIIIAISVMVLLLVIDIVTKLVVHGVFNGVEGANVVVIPNFFWIYLTYNRGALASFLADVSWGRIILSLLSIAGSAISIWYLVKKFFDLNIWYRIAIYLFIPGCTGNLIDRVGIYGTEGVIDFLKFNIFGYPFPVFNFADMCLTVSIFVFFFATIFMKEKDQELEKQLEEKTDE